MEAGGCTYQKWKDRMGGGAEAEAGPYIELCLCVGGGGKVSQRGKGKLDREGKGMGLMRIEGKLLCF